jgi:hypothetical protein
VLFWAKSKMVLCDFGFLQDLFWSEVLWGFSYKTIFFLFLAPQMGSYLILLRF